MPSGLQAMKQEIKRREERQEREASNENQVFIPNLFPKNGDTSILFISDLDAPREELEMVWFRHYTAWYLRNNENFNEKYGKTFVYNSSDELHPEYIRELDDIQKGELTGWKEPGKYQNGGMAYVFNLSAYKAIHMGKARTPVEMAYKEMWENTPENKRYPDNYLKPQLLWLKGGMVAGLQGFVNEQMMMGNDSPSLWDYKFTLSKTVQDGKTSYSLTPDWDFELDNLPDDIQKIISDLRENFSVPSLKEKEESMRYKGESSEDAPFDVEASYKSDEKPSNESPSESSKAEDNSDDDFEIPMPEFPEADEETKQGIKEAQKKATEAKGPSWLHEDTSKSDFKIGDSVSEDSTNDETKIEDSTASSTDNVEENSDNQSENTESDEVEDEQEPSFDW